MAQTISLSFSREVGAVNVSNSGCASRPSRFFSYSWCVQGCKPGSDPNLFSSVPERFHGRDAFLIPCYPARDFPKQQRIGLESLGSVCSFKTSSAIHITPTAGLGDKLFFSSGFPPSYQCRVFPEESGYERVVRFLVPMSGDLITTPQYYNKGGNYV